MPMESGLPMNKRTRLARQVSNKGVLCECFLPPRDADTGQEKIQSGINWG